MVFFSLPLYPTNPRRAISKHWNRTLPDFAIKKGDEPGIWCKLSILHIGFHGRSTLLLDLFVPMFSPPLPTSFLYLQVFATTQPEPYGTQINRRDKTTKTNYPVATTFHEKHLRQRRFWTACRLCELGQASDAEQIPLIICLSLNHHHYLPPKPNEFFFFNIYHHYPPPYSLLPSHKLFLHQQNTAAASSITCTITFVPS